MSMLEHFFATIGLLWILHRGVRFILRRKIPQKLRQKWRNIWHPTRIFQEYEHWRFQRIILKRMPIMDWMELHSFEKMIHYWPRFKKNKYTQYYLTTIKAFKKKIENGTNEKFD